MQVKIDGYTKAPGVQCTLTEADVSNLILGLQAAMHNGGVGAFGGDSGWTVAYLTELGVLKNALLKAQDALVERAHRERV